MAGCFGYCCLWVNWWRGGVGLLWLCVSEMVFDWFCRVLVNSVGI